MRTTTLLLAAAALFATASLASAQTPTPSPSAAPTKGHRQKKATPEPTATPAATAAPASTPAAAAPAASPSPAKKTRAEKKADKAAKPGGTPDEVLNATPAPGGGPGMVWVNTKSHRYHNESSRYYGKTKQGKYLSEKDALAEGDKAAGEKTAAPDKK